MTGRSLRNPCHSGRSHGSSHGARIGSLRRRNPDGEGATVTINFQDARKGTIILDLTDSEAEQMGAKGRRQARRGKRPRYVSDVPTGQKPIEAVGTSTAGFVGSAPDDR